MQNIFRVWNKLDKKFYVYNDNSNIKWLIDMDGNLGYLSVDTMKWNGLISKDFYEINRSTGLKDSNGKEVFEGDIIPYHFDETIKGIVTYGEYKNPCDDNHCGHIGFYIEFENDFHKNTIRKDLGYWLKVSTVKGSKYEI